MHAIQKAISLGELARFAQTPESVPGSIDEIRTHGADEHWMVAGAAGRPLARCSLWWNNVPALPGHRIGLIGHYAASDETAAAELLDAACERLAGLGCSLAVGPMDGSTWRNHRLITSRGHTPPFFLDIDHPPSWPQHLLHNGFRALATYTSSLIPNTDATTPEDDDRLQRLQAEGITLRPLDDRHFEEELSRIYELSIEAFRHNFLYSPITESEFMKMYLPLRRFVLSELVLLAEKQGKLVGFVFCVPDHIQALQQRDTAILKTFAVHPDFGARGIGTMLVTQAKRAAASLGLSKLVIAFMHENNFSQKISARYATEIRRYTLFCRSLTDHEDH